MITLKYTYGEVQIRIKEHHVVIAVAEPGTKYQRRIGIVEFKMMIIQIIQILWNRGY